MQYLVYTPFYLLLIAHWLYSRRRDTREPCVT
jgi:hypothetical protein